MNKHTNTITDEFIAKWMSDDLNAQEMEAFKLHPDYAIYVKMKNASNQLSFKAYDNKKAFQHIKSKTNAGVVSLQPKSQFATWKYITGGIAAAAVLLIGVLFSVKSAVYSTKQGQQLAVDLPDTSKVILNAGSEISFSERKWKNDRSLNLKGEAYFKVEKGNQFTVNTSLGKVQVLGTQFTVNSIGNLFIVKCFEGRVGVTSGKLYKEITPGMALQIKNETLTSYKFEDLAPSWVTKNVSNFRKIQISELLTAFKRQYNIAVEGEGFINDKALFTGSFPNNNLEEAVKIIFETMNVTYRLEGNTKLVILKK